MGTERKLPALNSRLTGNLALSPRGRFRMLLTTLGELKLVGAQRSVSHVIPSLFREVILGPRRRLLVAVSLILGVLSILLVVICKTPRSYYWCLYRCARCRRRKMRCSDDLRNVRPCPNCERIGLGPRFASSVG